MASSSASSGRKLTDFATTLSFYNSSNTAQPSPLSSSASASSSVSGDNLLHTNFTVSLENRPLGFAGSAVGTAKAPACPPPVSSSSSSSGGAGGIRGLLGSLFGASGGGVGGGDVGVGGGGSSSSGSSSSGSSSGSGSGNAATVGSSSSSAQVLFSFAASHGKGGTAGVVEGSAEEEGQGLISGYAHKGLNLARNGVGTLTGGARSVVTTASNKLQESTVTLSPQRFMFFGVAAGVGCLFMILAFLFFPVIIIAPGKFALLFTCGSISFVVSFSLLKGFNTFLAHIISWERLPFTFTYVISLVLTLYVTLVAPSRILALLFSLVQICALLSFLISYLPGGTGMLRMIGGVLLNLLKSTFRCKDSGGAARAGPPLPI